MTSSARVELVEAKTALTSTRHKCEKTEEGKNWASHNKPYSVVFSLTGRGKNILKAST